ncbi:MAG TPA: hypothetical protein VFQ40_00205 [Actinomycetota bacterium]|nr:hypothetical protein [Actinomycetota bacterium]
MASSTVNELAVAKARTLSDRPHEDVELAAHRLLQHLDATTA